jgi:L-threonylcarbamoyladenylate synthase
LIVDAGPAPHGIESTIIAVSDGKIGILRRGPVTAAQLSKSAEVRILTPTGKVFAPGQLSSHYAPKTPLRLVDNVVESNSPQKDQRVGLLAWNPVKSEKRFAAVRCLSEQQDLREAAANLFRFLRELDQADIDLIIAERVPPRGLGAAIMDRLQRAAHDPSEEQGRPE